MEDEYYVESYDPKGTKAQEHWTYADGAEALDCVRASLRKVMSRVSGALRTPIRSTSRRCRNWERSSSETPPGQRPAACQLRPQSDVAVIPILPPNVCTGFVRGRHRMHMGEERYVVSMFVDMRGSTKLSEVRLPFNIVTESIADSPSFAKVKRWFETKVHIASAG